MQLCHWIGFTRRLQTFRKKEKNNERTSEYLQDKLEKDGLKNRFILNYLK